MNEVAHDPWVFQAAKQAAVPVGFYNADFVGVEDVQLDPKGNDDGKRWRWTWKVATGPCTGQLATALTKRELRDKTHAGRLILGLLGRAIVAGENVKASFDACVGQVYMVSVQAGPKGGKPSVQSVDRPPQM